IVGVRPELLAGDGIEAVHGILVVLVAHGVEATLADGDGGEAGAHGRLPGDGWSVLGPLVEPVFLCRDAVEVGPAPAWPVVGAGNGSEQDSDQARSNPFHEFCPPGLSAVGTRRGQQSRPALLYRSASVKPASFMMPCWMPDLSVCLPCTGTLTFVLPSGPQ